MPKEYTPSTRDIKLVQKRVVNMSIGSSTLRNQGIPDVEPTVTTIAREFLHDLDLSELSTSEIDEFKTWLNCKTKKLEKNFMDVAPCNWGAARKAINVFLENAYYDRLLSKEYNLKKLERMLEIPLDSNVVKKLRKDAAKDGISCPKNTFTIKGLKSGDSEIYQKCAAEVAEKYKMPRIYLDLHYWRAED